MDKGIKTLYFQKSPKDIVNIIKKYVHFCEKCVAGYKCCDIYCINKSSSNDTIFMLSCMNLFDGDKFKKYLIKYLLETPDIFNYRVWIYSDRPNNVDKMYEMYVNSLPQVESNILKYLWNISVPLPLCLSKYSDGKITNIEEILYRRSGMTPEQYDDANVIEHFIESIIYIND